MNKLLFFFCLLFLFSCKKDDEVIGPTTTFNLIIKPVYNGAPFKINKGFNFDGRKVLFEKFDFFLSGVGLLEAGSKDEYELLEIAHVDFASGAFTGTDTFISYKVPVGNYRGIRIGIGVPVDLNKSSASAFGAGHPLKANFESHYWFDAKSFIFLRSEGVYDLNDDGQFGEFPVDHPFLHTPAKNSNYTSVVLLKPIQLLENKPYNLEVTLDVRKLYDNGTSIIDFSHPDALTTADPNNLSLASFIMRNFEFALSVE
jgi:hypothetical protein